MLAITVSTATAQKRDITADFKDANFLREVRREINFCPLLPSGRA
jgi:hypothetical protein